MIALGGQIECINNWQIYIEEFVIALAQLSGVQGAAERFAPRPGHATDSLQGKNLASGHMHCGAAALTCRWRHNALECGLL